MNGHETIDEDFSHTAGVQPGKGRAMGRNQGVRPTMGLANDRNDRGVYVGASGSAMAPFLVSPTEAKRSGALPLHPPTRSGRPYEPKGQR